MSQYYKAKRTQNIFNPNSREPFRLSRSKIDLFLECARCFYLDRRLGVGRPPGYPFNLNSAVDTLLKKEFDIHRSEGSVHPIMKAYGINAVPYKHDKIDEWRDALKRGITYHHRKTNLIITGGVDDVWINSAREVIVVDYKSTAKSGEINLDAEWQDSYKRQMEVYQWLFRQNGFVVSPIGYFVYCNGLIDKEKFDGKLEFDVKLIPYKGDDKWVEPTVIKAHQCLMGAITPPTKQECDYCEYYKAVRSAASDRTQSEL